MLTLTLSVLGSCSQLTTSLFFFPFVVSPPGALCWRSCCHTFSKNVRSAASWEWSQFNYHDFWDWSRPGISQPTSWLYHYSPISKILLQLHPHRNPNTWGQTVLSSGLTSVFSFVFKYLEAFLLFSFSFPNLFFYSFICLVLQVSLGHLGLSDSTTTCISCSY